MSHDEEILGKAYDARLMRRLLGYLRPYRRQVVIASVAIVGHSLIELAPPLLTKLLRHLLLKKLQPKRPRPLRKHPRLPQPRKRTRSNSLIFFA